MSTGTAFRHRTANEVSHDVIGAALRVHSELGPGLLESTYEACLAFELREARHAVQTQVALPVTYHDVHLDVGYRIDMIVDDIVVVEIKAAEGIAPIHEAQLMSYMKLSGKSLGLLINFNVVHLKDGIRRRVIGTNWR